MARCVHSIKRNMEYLLVIIYLACRMGRICLTALSRFLQSQQLQVADDDVVPQAQPAAAPAPRIRWNRPEQDALSDFVRLAYTRSNAAPPAPHPAPTSSRT